MSEPKAWTATEAHAWAETSWVRIEELLYGNLPNRGEQMEGLRATLRAYADMVERQYVPQEVVAHCLEVLDAAGMGKPGMGGNTLWTMTDQIAAKVADQGERIERLRAGMRHDSTCKKGESRLMACTCGLDTLLKEDDSHV